jgi:hypothetical protein
MAAQEDLTIQEASRAKGFSDKTVLLKRQQKKYDDLVNTIFEIGNKEMVLHICEKECLSFPVSYKAVKGECVYKTGKKEGQKYKCWVSCYGNYAGSLKTTIPPILKMYVLHIEFEWDDTKKGTDRLIHKRPLFYDGVEYEKA